MTIPQKKAESSKAEGRGQKAEVKKHRKINNREIQDRRPDSGGRLFA